MYLLSNTFSFTLKNRNTGSKGSLRSSFGYTNHVKDNLIEPGKEVEDMKQQVLIGFEVENEDYYGTSETRKKDE